MTEIQAKYSFYPALVCKDTDMLRCPHCGYVGMIKLPEGETEAEGNIVMTCPVCNRTDRPEVIAGFEGFIPYGDGSCWKVCFPSKPRWDINW